MNETTNKVIDAIKNGTEIEIEKQKFIDLFNDNVIDTEMCVGEFEREDEPKTKVRIKGEKLDYKRDDSSGWIGEYKVWLDN